jgi:hypothetical protein
MYFIRFLLVWMVAYETNGKCRNRQLREKSSRGSDFVEFPLGVLMLALRLLGVAEGDLELVVGLL